MRNNLRKEIALLYLCIATLTSCDLTETPNPVTAPATYSFERNGASTVSYGGQSARIAMAEELITAMKDVNNSTATSMVEMYRNETASGGDANPFAAANLNGSTKSIRSKVANSKDFFSDNTTEGAIYKDFFENLIKAQYTEVFLNWEILATAGRAGQVADGSSSRFVSGRGIEYNQLLAKGLIGALMLDQINNHYLGIAVQDEADNRANNEAIILEDGKNYTTMEHKWDEAFGYLFGAAADGANALSTVGSDDNFLNKYLGGVDQDSDFEGIAQTVFDAFKLGRAAIVAHNYVLRDEQVAIIRANLSKVVAIRGVHYLQSGKNKIVEGNRTGSFHALSEGFGFISSLRYTRLPATKESYISATEINAFIAGGIYEGNGLWDITPEFIDQVSGVIGQAFGFDVAKTIN